MPGKGLEEDDGELARVGESAPPELSETSAGAASPIALAGPDASRDVPAAARGATPAATRRGTLLALQRTAGNARVVRMLERRTAPPGEERTPVSSDALEQALLAHERAHAERRNSGEPVPAPEPAGPTSGTLARWATSPEGWATSPERRVLARDDKSSSASKPSSCLGSSRDDDANTLMRDEAEEYAKRHEIKLTPERDDNPKDMPVGYKPHFHISSGKSLGTGGEYETYTARKWYVMGPDDSEPRTMPDWGGHDFSITMDKEGQWAVVAEVHVGDKTLLLDRQQYIVSRDKFADEAFKSVDKADYVTYRLLLNQERAKRAGAELDQSKPAGAYITNEGPDAANPAPASTSGSFSYLVHSDPKLPQDHKPVKFHWWAIPRSPNLERDFKSRTDMGRRTTYKDEFAFYLGDGERASFRRSDYATIEIVCELIDARGTLVDTAHYTQVIMPQGDLDQVAAIEKMAREGAANYRKIVPDKAQGLKAMHLDARRGKTESLVLFYGPSADDPGKTMLIDLTPGAEYVEHEGKDLTAAIKHLDDNNSYSEGEIVIQVPGEAQPRRLKTTGESDLGEAAHKTGIGSMVLVGLGVVAGLIPGVDVAAPFLITAGLGTGAASAGLSLADELRKAKPSASAIALDVTAIVGSLMGAGTTIQAARMGSVELAMATATGRFFIYTGFAFDASGGILLIADTADKVEQIRNSTTMTEEEKIDAIEKLIVMAAVTGGLIAFGGHDIATAKTRVTGILGEERLAKLRPDQVYTLQALDDRVLAALKRLPEKDFEPVATALGKDPRKAAQLSKAYGEKFVDEVRANPGRSLQETGELLGAEAEGLPATAVGATRGPNVYKPDPARAIGTSPTRFERGMTSTKAGRLHGSTLENIKVNDKTPTLATLDLKVGTDTVSVAIELKETSKLTGGTHTTTGGPGPGRIVQLEPPTTAGGKWTASVELDAATAQDNVKFVLGHELDEVADFVATKGAAGIGALKDEAEAGVFVTWATRGTKTPAVTSHDRANAREFLSVAGDLKQLEAQLAKTPGDAALKTRVANRRESLEELITTMGLRDPQNIELKLAILRDSLDDMTGPAKDELMKYVKPRWTVMDVIVDSIQRSLTVTEFRAATAGKPNTTLTEHLVGKMRAQAQSRADFLDNGLYGGHHDPALREFIDANPTYAVVLKSEANHAGVTYRAYDQYRWNGTGTPPRPGSAGYPGASGSIDAGWELARRPKTTFDNPAGFYEVADDMIAKWKTSFSADDLKNPMKSAKDVKIGTDPDLMVAYSYDPPPTPDKPGIWNIGALYIDDAWVTRMQAAASTPTPAPGGVTK